MRVKDVTVQVRSLALGVLGEIDLGYVNDLSVVKRFNNVGFWQLSLPIEYDMTSALAAPGRGIKITGPGWVVSGPLASYVYKDSSEDVLGAMYFTGADDMIHLADAQAFPDPSVADPAAQTQAYDVRTGNAETVMRAYVNANRGASAPASRKLSFIALQTNLNRGDSITVRARFVNLGQLLASCSAQGGGLGFDMVQVDDEIQFSVYVPQDKHDTIRMDIANDMLTSTEYGSGAPSATRAIVAGQGEGADRKFVQVTSTESLAAEAEWGRKIEFFKDRRDTDDDTELEQEGNEIVATNGVTIRSLSVTPADDIANQEFGLDWFLGDKVGVVVDGQPVVSVVTEAVIIIDQNGVRVGATLGDPVGFDYDSKLVAQQQDHEERISNIERNAEATPPVEFATGAETITGTETGKAVTPAGLAAVTGPLDTRLDTAETDIANTRMVLDLTPELPIPTLLPLASGMMSLAKYDKNLSNTVLGPPMVYLSSGGWVSCVGLITSASTIASGTVIATLPVGLRPDTAMVFAALVAGGAGAVLVDSNGDISLVKSGGAAAGTWISLSNICFNLNTHTSMSLTSPFAAYSSGTYGLPRYYVSPEGIISLAGVVNGGTLGNTAWVAPVGLGLKSSLYEVHMQGITTAGAFSYGNAQASSRALRPRGGQPASLSGIHYLTDGASEEYYKAPYASWSRYASPFPDAGVVRTDDGMILLHGLMKGGSLGGTAFFLPSGYRPSRDLIFMSPSNDATGYLRIYQNGAVTPTAGSTTWFSVDGIMFAAQR